MMHCSLPFSSEAAQRMYALVAGYSKWSFSLGAVVAFASMWMVFRRWGYNAAELLALSDREPGWMGVSAGVAGAAQRA